MSGLVVVIFFSCLLLLSKDVCKITLTFLGNIVLSFAYLDSCPCICDNGCLKDRIYALSQCLPLCGEITLGMSSTSTEACF